VFGVEPEVEAGDDGPQAGGVGRGGLVAQQESMVGADGQSAACGDQEKGTREGQDDAGAWVGVGVGVGGQPWCGWVA